MVKKEDSWYFKNRFSIVQDLEYLISDVKDQHDSFPGFIRKIEHRIKRWKERKSIDEFEFP